MVKKSKKTTIQKARMMIPLPLYRPLDDIEIERIYGKKKLQAIKLAREIWKPPAGEMNERIVPMVRGIAGLKVVPCTRCQAPVSMPIKEITGVCNYCDCRIWLEEPQKPPCSVYIERETGLYSCPENGGLRGGAGICDSCEHNPIGEKN